MVNFVVGYILRWLREVFVKKRFNRNTIGFLVKSSTLVYNTFYFKNIFIQLLHNIIKKINIIISVLEFIILKRVRSKIIII